MRDRPARALWLRLACGGLFALAPLCAALADEIDPPAPEANRTSAVYKLIGAGLTLRYEAAACGIVLTPKQRGTIASKLDALIAEAKAPPAEVAAFKTQIQSKIDPLIEANANFCTTIARSFASYVSSFAAELPTADWEDAAQSASGGSVSFVNGWSIDTHDCTITSSVQDDKTVTGVFVGKLKGGVAMTLQNDAWTWDKDAVVPATTLVDNAVVQPLVDWHATKAGPFLVAVFPPTTLSALALAKEIKLKIDGAGETVFRTTGIGDALSVLGTCGQ